MNIVPGGISSGVPVSDHGSFITGAGIRSDGGTHQ
ncbi:hypothetical protein HNP84_009576 [Thermocatellispora tengchongensis]|uniref:Uncharacterized protein n=1 Tax=Thermocatellispora tengchongensis TaxID=1073253 RepID=A0A840PL45_9ACTN|nr:hypothetical protein [Thermocatellispora tengchongensis]